MNNKDLIHQINSMKDEEKKFFKFCCKHLDCEKIYNDDGTSQIGLHRTTICELIKEFHDEYGVNMNLLRYYVYKWYLLDMIDYSVYLEFGCFNLGLKTPIRYVVLMPDRIFKKLRKNGVNFPI